MNYDINTEEGLANAVTWFLAHVSRMNNGGVWVLPRSGTIYTVDHDAKTLTCTLGGDPSTERVAVAAEWKVQQHD